MAGDDDAGTFKRGSAVGHGLRLMPQPPRGQGVMRQVCLKRVHESGYRIGR
ncbi:hypothetical protein I603_0631 [Erythrobacter dokdonensis DSW-74]|uniref:Uncharacterized protein n=1 Tax=Erythrobacter dokdonensis DSW-74 TaxID=1300349 RepID=A0A1A7BMW0_9SPHN|nr:hypothetical protein I603_0631 [Erythrobacter dokdonensis DSW-74]